MLPAFQISTSLLSWDALANAAPLETRSILGLMGILLLVFGSRSTRLVSAAPGALLGITLASLVLSDQSLGVQIGGALAAGVAGGVVAMLVQSIALRCAGALIGGIGATVVFPMLSSQALPPWWLPLAGAIIGGLLLPRLFNAALSILSPVLGAMCLTFALGLEQNHQLYGIVGFSILGFAMPFLFAAKKPEPES
jgi:hypothetical protein